MWRGRYCVYISCCDDDRNVGSEYVDREDLEDLEVEQSAAQLLARLPVEMFPHLVGQLEGKAHYYERTPESSLVYLVSVLAGSGHPHSPRPVEVHVSQLVTENKNRSKSNLTRVNKLLPDPLHGVHGESQAVVDDDVVGGGDGALADVLGDEEEVVPVPLGDGVVQHGPGGRIVQLLPHPDRNKRKVTKC